MIIFFFIVSLFEGIVGSSIISSSNSTHHQGQGQGQGAGQAIQTLLQNQTQDQQQQLQYSNQIRVQQDQAVRYRQQMQHQNNPNNPGYSAGVGGPNSFQNQTKVHHLEIAKTSMNQFGSNQTWT